jgi:hypothetical protein
MVVFRYAKAFSIGIAGPHSDVFESLAKHGGDLCLSFKLRQSLPNQS